MDLSALTDDDLAILYCGVWLTHSRGRALPAGTFSASLVNAALTEELERRAMSTGDAAALVTQLMETSQHVGKRAQVR